MKISVITVCLNCEKTIEDTISSVINQDYNDIEYIIIDGKSEDNTVNILKKYEHKIFKVISEKDHGIYDGINKGIQLASGEIISLIHGNDVFSDSNVLSRVALNFKKNNDIDLLIGDITFKKNLMEKNTLRYYSSKSFKPWMLRIGFSPPHLSSFFTKKILSKIGPYDNQYKIAGDFEYFVRCFLKNNISFKLISDCFVTMSSGGLSGKNYKSYLVSSLEINKALKKNNYYSNILLTFMRFPLKLIQFLVK